MRKSFHLIACCLLVGSMSFISCSDDDEFTFENKVATGDFTYIQTGFIPLTFDSTGTIPLSAQIAMEGNGNVEGLGDLHMVVTFIFDFIQGQGTDFDATYTGTQVSDVIHATGSSQLQPNGTFIVMDELVSGTGKFAKISGGGATVVTLNQALDAGTGVVNWTVTY